MTKHTAETLQQAFKYLFIDEVPALKQLAQSLPDDPVVVNLGAGAGTSGLTFMESREDLFLYTVDIQRESSPFGCLKAEETILHDAGFDQTLFVARNVQIQSHSIKLGLSWLKNKEMFYSDPDFQGWGWGSKLVDMVFIDADHSYEGCKGDIEAWLPNIKPGGILAVHDYKKETLYTDDYHIGHPHSDRPAPKPHPGVDKAVDELLVDKYEMILRVESLIAFRII